MAIKLIRYLITFALLAAAVWASNLAWGRYMESAWTRDGRIKAEVISITADVGGLVTQVAVHDNQRVRKGDLLFSIDTVRFQDALAQANAQLATQKTELARRTSEASRRAGLEGSIVSTESREAAQFAAAAAAAQYQAALAARDTAQLNLARTAVRAPVDGYVTNLNVHAGEFAAQGSARLAIIDLASFYAVGYFEETKLALLAPGDAVRLDLLGGGAPLLGHIDSIAHGITDRDAATGRELLADINPTFNWVRLAQRVPVRIRIDAPAAVPGLIAGTSCTVVVTSHAARPAALGAAAPAPRALH